MGRASRHTVLVVYVSELFREIAVRIFYNLLKIMDCNNQCYVSLMQCYLEMESVNLGLVALLLSYGGICSSRLPFLVIGSPVKAKLPTPNCLSP